MKPKHFPCDYLRLLGTYSQMHVCISEHWTLAYTMELLTE